MNDLHVSLRHAAPILQTAPPTTVSKKLEDIREEETQENGKNERFKHSTLVHAIPINKYNFKLTDYRIL